MASDDKVIVLEIALPSIYTADIESLWDQFRDEFDSESDFLLNTIGEPSVVRLRTETMGEKESSVTEVWGNVRSAKLVEPIPSDDEDGLAEVGFRLMRDEDGCEHCTLHAPLVDREEGSERER